MKKEKLFLLYLIVGLLFICLVIYTWIETQKIKEGFLDKKIVFHDWTGQVDEKDEIFFQNLFSNIMDRYDKINVYSVMGNNEVIKYPNQINIQMSGESYYRDTNMFDLNFIPAPDSSSPNVIIFPIAGFNTLVRFNDKINSLTLARNYSFPKQKFCLFAVSNCGCEQRNQMFTQLSTYKTVDSCGRCMNNMGQNCPGSYFSQEYFDFVSQYKFMICFENTSQPNYFTEKLVNAYMTGTIPIYWGCPNIDEFVNTDAFLCLSPNFTQQEMDQLIEKIKYLDNNENAYKEMYEKPLFKNGKIPDCFDIDKVKKQMETILS